MDLNNCVGPDNYFILRHVMCQFCRKKTECSTFFFIMILRKHNEWLIHRIVCLNMS